MLFRLVKQIAEREGMAEQFKANHRTEWVSRAKTSAAEPQKL